jgi:hypothetical protein
MFTGRRKGALIAHAVTAIAVAGARPGGQLTT